MIINLAARERPSQPPTLIKMLLHKRLREVKESRSVASDSLRPQGICSPWNSPGQNPGVGSLSLPQGIFPTQGWNPGLPHGRRILYQLSHQRSPRILEWVAIPSPENFPDPGLKLRSPSLQADSLPVELPGWWCFYAVCGALRAQKSIPFLPQKVAPFLRVACTELP